VEQVICDFSRRRRERNNGAATQFLFQFILTLLYDISKSVFDPLDGTDSIPHLARNYHLAAFQHGAVARPDPKILSFACNREIKMISIQRLRFFGTISSRVFTCRHFAGGFTRLIGWCAVDYKITSTPPAEIVCIRFMHIYLHEEILWTNNIDWFYDEYFNKRLMGLSS